MKLNISKVAFSLGLLVLMMNESSAQASKNDLIALFRNTVEVRQFAQMIKADSSAGQLSSIEKSIGDEIIKIMREEVKAEKKLKEDAKDKFKKK
jgi:hypothetical protein